MKSRHRCHENVFLETACTSNLERACDVGRRLPRHFSRDVHQQYEPVAFLAKADIRVLLVPIITLPCRYGACRPDTPNGGTMIRSKWF